MVDVAILPTNVLVLRPSGPIESADIAEVREKVDGLLAGGDRLTGVLIEATAFPGWKDFAAMTSHFRFVRDHQKDIPRVAIVTDNHFLHALPKLARHFVRAEFRHFAAGRRDEALEWIHDEDLKPPAAIRRGWFPDRKLIWLYVHGRVETEAYREVVRWMEPILRDHAPVSFVIDLQDMEGADPGAVIADMKFGFTHAKQIERVALIGSEKWVRRLAEIPNPFSVEIRAFDEAGEYGAWDWAAGRSAESEMQENREFHRVPGRSSA
ncbi:MAG: STAS/SEC14 domain-containing protein [Akkermansiaceae bacterium]|nr:STAS/SEC14 domain-containing protein [Akkermansiaceae bacterium]MCP5548359.1 STAS/SEC14 domain-containing protein [Akkermansiaceae bacterium]